MGGQNDEVGRRALEVPKARRDGVRVLGHHLSHIDAQRGHRAPGTAGRQDAPPFQHLPHARKVRPIGVVRVPNVEDVEVGVGEQRDFEGVGERDLAARGKIRGMKDAAHSLGWGGGTGHGFLFALVAGD